RRLHELVHEARRISVLTGAGVSTAAGLPDFQDAFGLWTGQSRITLADFLSSPAARESYWREEERFFRRVQSASPTETHRALATLYRRGRLTAVVTQNVDGLHQAAGLPPESVIELHGNIHEARCVDCGQTVARETLSPRISAGVTTLYCNICQGLLKGGSLLFGEQVEPRRLEAALRALLASELLLVLGTSLAVAPASDLLQWARDAGIPVAIVNATPTPYDSHATVKVTADVGPVLLDLLESDVLEPIPPAAPHPTSR
ncbi:MAG: Sir2 family NAD-dependent protein deacetylase, partial [Candidatus Methylomirabilales bacterium]